MENLDIPETFKSPEVNFDPSTGVFEIKGRSILEDPGSFYEPILGWLDKYTPDKSTKIEMKMQFYYYNTSSAKRIREIIKKLASLYKKGNDVKVIWTYDVGDEDGEQSGKELSETVSVPFEFIEVEDEDEDEDEDE